jgi:hypothetical protein
MPTFLYQAAHTGTPWGEPALPALPIGYTLADFGGASLLDVDLQEGWALFLVLLPLLLLGVFARGTDERHLEIDVRTQPEARTVAFVGGAGLVVALSVTYLAGEAFQTRYGALVFPFFVLLVARGLTTLRDTRILAGVLVVVVALGFTAGVRLAVTQRTQAGEVADVLRARAAPGDLVVYCPDQLGPAVHRLGPPGLDEVMYPSFAGPERVDWVDYKERLARTDDAAFARAAVARAGGRTIWLVTAPGYLTHEERCRHLSDVLAAESGRTRLARTASKGDIFERPALEELPARGAPG